MACILDPGWTVRNQMLQQSGVMNSVLKEQMASPLAAEDPVTQSGSCLEEDLEETCSYEARPWVRRAPPVTIKRTPLFNAVVRQDPKLVERLLASGLYDESFDGIIEEWGDFIYVGALWVAVMNRDLKSAELLLEKGADVNRTTQKCGHVTRHYYASSTRTPLAQAGAVGDEAMLKLLIRFGADPDIECIDEDHNGFSTGDGSDSRTYHAKHCVRVGMHHLSQLLDDYTQERAAALQDYLGPALLDEEEEEEGGVFLTHRLAKQLLEELVTVGKASSTREEVLEAWGFASPREAEGALKLAIAQDSTGKLQELKDLWLSRLMKGGGFG